MPAHNDIKAVIALIQRSPDYGEGWRKVSKMCMPLVLSFPDKTLLEWEVNDDGTGRVRLSPKGETVAPYL